MDRLIKKVREESWMELKAESARHGMRMGEFLGYLIKEHKKNEGNGNGWEQIMNAKRIISDEEAEKIKKATAKFEQVTEFEEI